MSTARVVWALASAVIVCACCAMVACSDDSSPESGVTTGSDAGSDIEEVGEEVGPDVEDDTSANNSGREVQVTVSGRVTDLLGNPVPRVRVVTEPVTEPGTTDQDGRYELQILVALGTVYRVTAECGRLPCDPPPPPVDITFSAVDQRTVDFILSLECIEEELFCDGVNEDCDDDVDEGVKNPCGGCASLGDVFIGSTCGVCSAGLWVCANQEEASCQGSGVEVPEAGEACDDDGAQCGMWACADGAAVCQDPEEGCP